MWTTPSLAVLQVEMPLLSHEECCHCRWCRRTSTFEAPVGLADNLLQCYNPLLSLALEADDGLGHMLLSGWFGHLVGVGHCPLDGPSYGRLALVSLRHGLGHQGGRGNTCNEPVANGLLTRWGMNAYALPYLTTHPSSTLYGPHCGLVSGVTLHPVVGVPCVGSVGCVG